MTGVGSVAALAVPVAAGPPHPLEIRGGSLETPAATPRWLYAVFTVGNEDDDFAVADCLNDHGLLGGNAVLGAVFVWMNGVKTYTDIPVGEPRRVNNLGWLVGDGKPLDGSSGQYAFLWRPDGEETIVFDPWGAPPESWSYANDVNDAGQVVGAAAVEGFDPYYSRAFLWQEAVGYADLGDPYGQGSGASGINQAGRIVGGIDLPDHDYRAVTWDQDVPGGPYALLELDWFGFSFEKSTANAVNNRDIAVGLATQGSQSRAVAWDAATGAALIELHDSDFSDESSAFDINDLNTVVGWADGVAFDRATIWDRFSRWRPQRLSKRLPPRHDWDFLFIATDVNEKDQIVGWGINDRFPIGSGYWLVPVEAALTLEPPAPGLAGANNTLTVTGAVPGSTVDFYYGLTGGGAFVPGCESAADESNVALQIQTEALKWAGSAVADATGTATLVRFVPPSARAAGDILIQAADSTNCQVSQLIIERFE